MPHPCGAIAPTTVCGFFGRYNAPFPFGLRHADGSPMTKAETVRRLVKLQVPMFTIPRSRITAPGTSQAVGSGSRKQAHWRCLTPPPTHTIRHALFSQSLGHLLQALPERRFPFARDREGRVRGLGYVYSCLGLLITPHPRSLQVLMVIPSCACAVCIQTFQRCVSCSGHAEDARRRHRTLMGSMALPWAPARVVAPSPVHAPAIPIARQLSRRASSQAAGLAIAPEGQPLGPQLPSNSPSGLRPSG